MRNNLCFILFIFLFSCSFSAFSQESINDLYAKGNQAFSEADYITSTYYYQRLIELDKWSGFAKKIDVLRKLAMIEESQARFDDAARYYRLLIDNLPESKNPNTSTINYFYYQRYAENLEKTGKYTLAGQTYWKLVHESKEVNRPVYVKHLIQNYEYRQVSDEQIDELKNAVLPQYLDDLGLDFAELLRIQGKTQDSINLFNQLWPVNPVRSLDFVTNIADLFASQEKLDELIGHVHLHRTKVKNSPALLMFEVNLLEQAERGADALEQIEQFIFDKSGLLKSEDIEPIIIKVPAMVLDHWVELVTQYRNIDDGIKIISQILAITPMDLTRRKQLSGMLIREGRKQEAVDLWRNWAVSQTKTPTTILNAAQEIYTLGDLEAARSVLRTFKGRIPAPLAWRQGQAALQFGDHKEAIAAFNIAVATGKVHPSLITSVINQHIQTHPDQSQWVAELVKAASGKLHSAVPGWLKTSLLNLGVQPPYRKQLEELLESDSSDAWKYSAALESIKQGDNDWALAQLDDIPQKSLYFDIAKQKRSAILGEDDSLNSQRKAADLFESYVADILSSASPVVLTSPMLERLIQYSEISLNAYKPEQALKAIHKIESASSALKHPIKPSVISQLTLNRARAFTELGSLDPAIKLLESIEKLPYREDAQLLLAKIFIAQRKSDMGLSILNDIAQNVQFWRTKNDALGLMNALEPLVGDPLQLFCDAMLYRLQGRLANAIPLLRQLAVDHYGGDVEEWSRYHIGKLKQESGDNKGAREEWRRLLTDIDHPVINGMTRLEILRMQQAASTNNASATDYQELMIELPNTIFADLARMEMQRQFNKEMP